jgi:Mg2+/Co2+ transporter CorB
MDPMPTNMFDTAFWLTCAAILALLVMSAFFSGSETALTASSRGKLKGLADKGSRGAKAAMAVTEDRERMIGALLLGNNIVNILSASLATALLTRLFGDSGVALATFVMTALVLIFGEVMPKTVAITFPEPVATRVAPIIRVLILIFSPLVSLVRAVVRGILRLIRGHCPWAFGRCGGKGRSRPASGRFGPVAPHGGRDHAPPPPGRNDRCRSSPG